MSNHRTYLGDTGGFIGVSGVITRIIDNLRTLMIGRFRPRVARYSLSSSRNICDALPPSNHIHTVASPAGASGEYCIRVFPLLCFVCFVCCLVRDLPCGSEVIPEKNAQPEGVIICKETIGHKFLRRSFQFISYLLHLPQSPKHTAGV